MAYKAPGPYAVRGFMESVGKLLMISLTKRYVSGSTETNPR